MPPSVKTLTSENIEGEIQRIFDMGPRAVGQTGHAKIRSYIREEILRLSKSHPAANISVREQVLTATVPVDVRLDENAQLRDGNATLRIGWMTLHPYAVYPNAVAPSFIAPPGIEAPLVDGGDGSLGAFKGKPIKNAIVVLDFESGKNWENAAKLGAAAVLFRHSEKATQGEAARKFFLVPLEMPRYLLSLQDTKMIDVLLKSSPGATAHLEGGASWKTVDTSNILALIPGGDSNPAKAANLLVIQIYVDSMCVAPGAPHGADTSLQLIAGLNLLRTMTSDPAARPACSVLFAFTDGHSQALLGARNLAYLFSRNKDNTLNTLDQDAAAAEASLASLQEALASVDNAAKPGAAATKVLMARSEALLTRGSIRTARAIQEAFRAEGDGPRVAALRKVRDWYAAARSEGAVGNRLRLLREGPPIVDPRDAALGITPDSLREALGGLIAHATRSAAIARSEADIAGWLFTNRRGARIQGLFLELAPDSDQVSWAPPSHFGLDIDGRSLFPNMYAAQLPVSRQMARELGLSQESPLDDAFSIEATVQRGNLLAPAVADGNPLHNAGVPSFGLVSINTARSRIDTPGDVPATIGPQKAADTIRFLCAFVPYISHDLGMISLGKKPSGGPFTLTGRVVQYDMMAGVSPNDPVAGAMAYYPLTWLNTGNKEENRTVAGVRYAAIDTAGPSGKYELRNLPDSAAKYHRKSTQLYAFRVDAAGRIDMALDNSSLGTEMLSNVVSRSKRIEEVSAVVAPARGVALFDLTDPRTLTPLTEIRALDAANMGALSTWSTFLSQDNHGRDETAAAPIEECGLIFAPPASRIVPIISAGFSGVRATALNLGPSPADGKEPPPQGYSVEQTPRLDFTALQVSRDMVRLNEIRLAAMQREGMRDDLLARLVAESRTALDTAEKLYAERDYANAYREATQAWGVALRAHGPVKNLGKDAVIGSVFFMALCLPFAFFMERLTIRAKGANARVLWTIAWFAMLFLVLLGIHPAFRISLNPMIVLLSFVMLVLVAVVGTIIYGKFTALIRAYRNQLEGVHGADIQRFSAGGVALSLSLSTMARRRARTVLTAATLTMLAFAIVTFSSINTGLKFQQTPIAGVTPRYTGLMFRMPYWADMPRSVVSSFMNDFGTQHTVLPRMWKLRSQDPLQLGVSGSSVLPMRKLKAAGDVSTGIQGIVGVTPAEDMLIDMKTAITHGTWIRRGHDEDMVIPPQVAAALGITPEDLGTVRASVRILDQTFTVVGIMDPKPFTEWQDLDGESFAPADYAAAGVVGSGQASDLSLENLPSLDVSQRMLHLPFDQLVISSIRRTEQMQGTYKSVAVRFSPDADADQTLQRTMRRLRLPVFAGFVRPAPQASSAGLYESQDKADPKGFGRLVVPVLLAVFMIVNTLLGTVEERRGEIGMLNSVGLAPAHVGMLFLVEAVVYGVIGLVVGYMFGLFMAKFVLPTPWFISLAGGAGVSLNYSSGATILASVLVLVIVVASALYPASQARKVATPGAMARWKLPPSDTGEFSIEVPFTLTGGNALGMLGFLGEYLDQHTDATSPDFRITSHATRETDDPAERAIILEGQAYLAPYDLGVSTDFQVRVRPAGQANIFRVNFVLARRAGEMTAYRRAAQRYVDLLRRQFLVWRTLEPDEKQKYVQLILSGVSGAQQSVV